MSSASEERRKIEEEIRQKQKRLNELDKLENGSKSQKASSISTFALYAFIANIMIVILSTYAWASLDSANLSGTLKTIMIATSIFSFACLVINAIVIFNRYKNFSSFFTGFVIVINLPSFLLAIILIALSGGIWW